MFLRISTNLIKISIFLNGYHAQYLNHFFCLLFLQPTEGLFCIISTILYSAIYRPSDCIVGRSGAEIQTLAGQFRGMQGH